MITTVNSPSDLGDYTFDISIGKRSSNDIPMFSQLKQVQPTSATLDTGATSGDDGSPALQLNDFISNVDIVWRLNSNPLIRIVAALPLDKLFMLIDFNGFSKNGVIGARFRKEQFSQSTDWVYGTIPYSIPRLENERRSLKVEGYGLLFEAPRRQVSRNFKNITAKTILSILAKKYNLGFTVRGDVPDTLVQGAEQNESDFSYINRMSAILNSYWYLEGSTLVLVGRSFMYSQTPEVTLLYDKQITANLGVQFPIYEFTPLLTATAFEAGALLIRSGGIDLDTGSVVKADFKPQALRLGSLSLNSSQFLSNEGVTVNGVVVRPAPELAVNEAGIILPLKTRSNDAAIYRFSVEHKDLEVRASVVCPGIPKLRPGSMVSVDGVGELFGGNWLVEELTHSIGDDRGYTTSMVLVRNALGQINASGSFAVNVDNIENRPDNVVKKFAEVV